MIYHVTIYIYICIWYKRVRNWKLSFLKSIYEIILVRVSDLRASCCCRAQDTRTPGCDHPLEGQAGAQARPRAPPGGQCCSEPAAPPLLRVPRPRGSAGNNNIAQLGPQSIPSASRNIRTRIKTTLADIVGWNERDKGFYRDIFNL